MGRTRTRALVSRPQRRWGTTSREGEGGVEYYGAYGRVWSFSPLHDQQQQIFAVTDLNVSPKWELNFGVGMGCDGFDGSCDHEGDCRAAVQLGQDRRWISRSKIICVGRRNGHFRAILSPR